MRELRISDELYERLRLRAEHRGLDEVEPFLELLLAQDTQSDSVEARFTPEVVERLNRISASCRTGKAYSQEEVDAILAEDRSKFLKKQAS